MDPPVFAFSFLLALLTVLVFAFGPAAGASRTVPMSRGSGVTRARARLGRRLLTAEVALSLLLLVGAGLCIRTLGNLRTAPVGFTADNLLVFTTNPRFAGYGEDPSEAQGVYTRVLDELRAVPGIRQASFSGFAPLAGSSRRMALFLPGSVAAPAIVATLNVHPDFFETMNIPLVGGRRFDSGDTADAPLVAVVNQAFVREYLADGGSIGRRIGFTAEERDGVEVIGVVADAGYASVRDATPPVVFTNDAQYARGTSSRTFEVRTAGPLEGMAAAVREAVRRVDPRLPVLDLDTFTNHMEGGFAVERIFVWVTTVLAGLALLLSMTGLFGLASYSVAQRTREIGIRMALGARRETVLSQTIRDAIRPVIVGISIGILASLALTPILGNLVFGLAPYDPITLGAAALMMLVVAALAGYVPARRAARVDPVIALRNE
jgi:predicted permease